MASNQKNSSRRWIIVVTVLAVTIGILATYPWWAPRLSRSAGGFFRPYLELANAGNAALSDQTLLLHDRVTLAKEIETALVNEGRTNNAFNCNCFTNLGINCLTNVY